MSAPDPGRARPRSRRRAAEETSRGAAGVSTKIERRHLERAAVVYVRQSTLAQVREHAESTARQYALAEQAVALGWDRRDVAVIDADLGVSGRSTEGRDGFRELVSRVCLGEVGAIFGLEISRLARSSADLSRLLELARLTDTLLDRRRRRLRPGRLQRPAAARVEGHHERGRAAPAGRPVAGRETGRRRPRRAAHPAAGRLRPRRGRAPPSSTPTRRSRPRSPTCSPRSPRPGRPTGWSAAFAGRRFPLRAYGGAWAGQLRWGRLTHARVLAILNNPCYAGAYVFGRYACRRTVARTAASTPGSAVLPRDQWPVLIHDHHPGYISWESTWPTRPSWRPTTPLRRPPGPGGPRAVSGHHRLRRLRAADVHPLSPRRQRRLRVPLPQGSAGHPDLPSVPAGAVDDARRRSGCWPRSPRRGRAGASPPPTRSPTTRPRQPRRRAGRRTRPLRRRPRRAGLPRRPNRRTGWSSAPWRPAGRPSSPRSPKPKPALQAARNAAARCPPGPT